MDVRPPEGWKFSFLDQSGFYRYSAPLSEGGGLVKDHPRGSLGFTAIGSGPSWVYVDINEKPRAKSEREIVQKRATRKLENHSDTRKIRSGAGDPTRRVELEPPSELGEHLHFFRISVTGKRAYEWQETLAFRPGARTYFKCSAWPSEASFEHRSMLRRYCRDLATAWRDR